MAVKAADFDHPIVFLFAIWVGVIALTALARWVFASLGWTGPLGLVTGGVSSSNASNGVGSQAA
jgi:hypothetical protein